MCMTNSEIREDILKKAEELAENEIKRIYHGHCYHCDGDDEMDEEDVDNLMDSVCILYKCAMTRKAYWEMEEQHDKEVYPPQMRAMAHAGVRPSPVAPAPMQGGVKG